MSKKWQTLSYVESFQWADCLNDLKWHLLTSVLTTIFWSILKKNQQIWSYLICLIRARCLFFFNSEPLFQISLPSENWNRRTCTHNNTASVREYMQTEISYEWISEIVFLIYTVLTGRKHVKMCSCQEAFGRVDVQMHNNDKTER